MSTIGAAVVGTGFMGAVHTEALRRAGVADIGSHWLDLMHKE
jgi:hypothetical protein